VDQLEAKGVALRVLNFGGDPVDTRGATGRLVLNVFAAMAQFEREMMLERQREGIAKAKAQGRSKGRKPTMPFACTERVRKSPTSQLSWELVAEASTARLKAPVKPERISAELVEGTGHH
jgi:DNA invertase Pin-like site-specific DNA recombinase